MATPSPSSSSLPFLPHGLASFELKDLPGAYYIRDFFTKEQQELIRTQSVRHRGSRRGTITAVTGNRSKGPFVAPFLPRRSLHQQPEFIQLITKKLTSPFTPSSSSSLREGEDFPLFVKAPMQISVNVYEDPDYWIVPHKDGSGQQVAILSFGSHTILDFYHRPLQPGERILHTQVIDISGKSSDGFFYAEREGEDIVDEEIEPEKPTTGVFLEPGSCLFLTGAAFCDFAHGIQSRSLDVLESDSLANSHLWEPDLRSGTKFNRDSRVSIACWN